METMAYKLGAHTCYVQGMQAYMFMKIHVYSTLARLVVKEEKKTQTQYTTFRCNTKT